jgi:hypothetical protein
LKSGTTADVALYQRSLLENNLKHMAKIVLELSPDMNINDHVWDNLHGISKGEIHTDRQI